MALTNPNKHMAERDTHLWRERIPDSKLIGLCPICGNSRRKFRFEESGFLVWRCVKCGHMYISPQPSKATLAEFYSTTYMPKTDDESIYEEMYRPGYSAVIRAIGKAKSERGELLDIGAGFGGILVCAAADGWRVSGVEPNEGAYAICHKRLDAKAHLYQTILEEAQLPPNSFDCIVMLNTIDHMRNPLTTCRRASPSWWLLGDTLAAVCFPHNNACSCSSPRIYSTQHVDPFTVCRFYSPLGALGWRNELPRFCIKETLSIWTYSAIGSETVYSLNIWQISDTLHRQTDAGPKALADLL